MEINQSNEITNEQSSNSTQIRVYTSGFFDLFSLKHAIHLEKCKKQFEHTYLIVGVYESQEYTVQTHQQRISILKHCKWVDEVVYPAPQKPDSQWLSQLKCEKIVNLNESFADQIYRSILRNYDNILKREYLKNSSHIKIKTVKKMQYKLEHYLINLKRLTNLKGTKIHKLIKNKNKLQENVDKLGNWSEEKVYNLLIFIDKVVKKISNTVINTSQNVTKIPQLIANLPFKAIESIENTINKAFPEQSNGNGEHDHDDQIYDDSD